MGMASAELLHRGLVGAPRTLAIAGSTLFVLALVLAGCGQLNPVRTGGETGVRRDSRGAGCRAFSLRGVVLRGGTASLTEVVVPSSVAHPTPSTFLQFVFIGLAWQIILRASVAQSFSRVVLFLVLSAVAVCGGVVVSIGMEKPLLRAIRGKRAGPAEAGQAVLF